MRYFIKGIAIPLSIRHLNNDVGPFYPQFLEFVWNFFAMTCAETAQQKKNQETI